MYVLQTHLLRMHYKVTKNQEESVRNKLCIIEKQEKQHENVTIMNENYRQFVKSSVHETGNSVIASMQNGKNGLWHDACIILMWKMLETAFLAFLHT